MSIFDNIRNKAQEHLGDEQKSDEFLDKVARQATDRLGEDKAEHIRKVRDALDERIGSGPTPEQQADPGDLADPNQSSPDTPPAQ